MAWILTDPGDVVLVPVPTYGRLERVNGNQFSEIPDRFFADMNERMGTQVVGFQLQGMKYHNDNCP